METDKSSVPYFCVAFAISQKQKFNFWLNTGFSHDFLTRFRGNIVFDFGNLSKRGVTYLGKTLSITSVEYPFEAR